MKYVPRTLDSMVADLSLEVANGQLNDFKVYTWQLFNGLYYLEMRSIVHRDIKPQVKRFSSDNIFNLTTLEYPR